MSGRTIARVVGLVVAVIAALSITLTVSNDRHPISAGIIAAITVASAIFAFIFTPIIVFPPSRWVLYMIRHTEVSDLVAGGLGLVVGLLLAALASTFLGQ
ncbi:MAG TPA: hypothetical protein VKC57_00565, partial [Ktedonobacterales bacterium]|nr:hypothetical protein [Ktedonobacterales bacterium]